MGDSGEVGAAIIGGMLALLIAVPFGIAAKDAVRNDYEQIIAHDPAGVAAIRSKVLMQEAIKEIEEKY